MVIPLACGLFAASALVLASAAGTPAAPATTPSTTPADTAAVSATGAKDLEKIKALMADAKTPRTWLFTGDSITHGALWTAGWRSFPEIFAERVRWEKRRMSDIVVNTGISGNKVTDILGAYDWRVRRFKPDVVLILIGMNDCSAVKDPAEFGKNLAKLVADVRADGGIPVLQTPNTVAPGSRDKALPPFNEQIRKVAKEQDVILVDHYAFWESSAVNTRPPAKWLGNSIHPSGEGHRQMAVLIFKVLGLHDPKSACENVKIK
jgi:lysophospholipase L1-like esterase